MRIMWYILVFFFFLGVFSLSKWLKKTIGKSLTKFVNEKLSKTFKHFYIESLSIFPFCLENVDITVNETSEDPEGRIQFEKFEIILNASNILEIIYIALHNLLIRPNKPYTLRNYAILKFNFVGFIASSSNATFYHLFKPSKTTSGPAYNASKITFHEKSSKEVYGLTTSNKVNYLCMIAAANLIEVTFQQFSVQIDFPQEECEIFGNAKAMKIQFNWSEVLKSEGILILNDIESGGAEIRYKKQRALQYSGNYAKFNIDFHLPTGMHDVVIRMLGKEYANVHIKSFLGFFVKFQNAEDEVAMMKISKGVAPSGKMAACVRLESITVTLEDHRNDQKLFIQLFDGQFELATFKLTIHNEKIHKGKICHIESSDFLHETQFLPKLIWNQDFIISANLEKYLGAKIASVLLCIDGDSEQKSTFEGILMKKFQTVRNHSDFIDIDHMEASLLSGKLGTLSKDLLDWFIVLQDTSNRLPNPSYNHPKHVIMTANVHDMEFSCQPIHFQYVMQDPKCLKLNDFFNLPKLPIHEEQYVTFAFQQLKVHRAAEPNSILSEFSLNARDFRMQTVFPTKDLQQQYHISVVSDQDDPFDGALHHDLEESSEAIPKANCNGSIRDKATLQHKQRKTIFMNRMSILESTNSVFVGNATSHATTSATTVCATTSDKSICPEYVTVWIFDEFQVSFLLGYKLVLKFVKFKQFQIDVIDKLPFRSDNLNTRLMKNMKPFVERKLLETRNVFVNVSKGNITFQEQPNHMSVELSSIYLNASVAGVMKLQFAFNMIRRTIQRVTNRMECIKLCGMANVLVEAPVEEPPLKQTMSVNIGNCMIIIAAKLLPANDSSSQSGSIQNTMNKSFHSPPGDQSAPHASKNIKYAREKSSTLNASQHLGGRCLMIKIVNVKQTTFVKDNTMEVEFEKCEIFANDYQRQPFMILSDFRMHKSTESLQRNGIQLPDVSVQEIFMKQFHILFHPEMEIGELMMALLEQNNAYKTATAPINQNYLGIEYTSTSELHQKDENELKSSGEEYDDDDDESDFDEFCNEFCGRYSPTWVVMEDEFRNSDGKEDFMEQPNTPESNTESANVFNYSINRIKIVDYKITLDAPYEDDYVGGLMCMAMDEMNVEIELLKPLDLVQDEIAAFDLGPEQHQSSLEESLDSFVSYTNIQGGHTTLSMESWKLWFHSQKDPLFEMKNIVFRGPLYNASISDSRIPVEYALIDLLDTMTLLSFSEDDAAPISASMTVADPMCTIISKPQVPAKFYLDLECVIDSTFIHLYPESGATLTAITQAIDVCLPPNTEFSPLLAPWDNLRFWFHGRFSMQVHEFKLIKHSYDYLFQPVKVIVDVEDFSLHLDSQSLEMTSNRIEIKSDLFMKLLPGRGRHNAKLRSQTAHAQLITIPGLVFALRHTRNVPPFGGVAVVGSDGLDKEYVESENGSATTTNNRPKGRLYNHHDIYLYPALDHSYPIQSEYAETVSGRDKNIFLSKIYVQNEYFDELNYYNCDRFYYFRSSKFSIAWNIEMRLADKKDEPIAINIRLDNMVRILDALKQSKPSKDTGNISSNNSQRSGMKAAVLPPPKGIIRPPNTLTLPELLNKMEIQCVINKFVFASWPSATNLQGISTLQEFTDIQCRLTRNPLEQIHKCYREQLFEYIPGSHSRVFAYLPDAFLPSTSQSVSFSHNKAFNSPSTATSSKETTQLFTLLPSKDYPLQIDHFFMEIYLAEIYARNWSINQLSFASLFGNNNVNYNPMNSALGFTGPNTQNNNENQEPRGIDDVIELHKSIHKLSHASKVVISLTENGEVSNRSTTFISSGILKKRDESVILMTESDALPERKMRKTVRVSVSQTFHDSAPSGGSMELPSSNRPSLGVDTEFAIGKEWRRKTFGVEFYDSSTQRLSLLRRQTTGNRARMSKLSATEPIRNQRQSAEAYLSRGDKKYHSSKSTGNNADHSPHLPPAVSPVVSVKVPLNAIDSLVKRRRKQSELILPHMSSPNANTATDASVKSSSQKYDPERDGYRASLRCFLQNHAAFTPPSASLPESYQGKRDLRYTVTNHIHQARLFQRKNFGQSSPIPATVPMQNPENDNSESSSFGNKIWGLRVIDVRILVTVQIRDILFFYVTRCLELFRPNSEEEKPINEKPPNAKTSNKQDNAKSSGRRKRSSALNVPKPQEKVTLMDFLSVSEELAEDAPHLAKLKVLSTNQEKVPDINVRKNPFVGSFNHIEDDNSIIEVNSMTKQLLFSSDHKNSPKATSGRRKPIISKDPNMSEIYPAPLEDFGELQLIENEMLQSNMKLFDDINDDIIEDEDEDVGVFRDKEKHDMMSRVYQRGGRGLIRAGHSKGGGISGSKTMKSMGRSSSRIDVTNNRRRTALTDAEIPNTKSSKSAKPERKPAAKVKNSSPINQFFFIVEIIDPQLNFLDVVSHGSLIIVAGRSSLEGKRLNTAVLPPKDIAAGSYRDPKASLDPKRRQEIRLKMDGVSAFTVPTLTTENFDGNEEIEDEVHWKHMQSTSDTIMQQTAGHHMGSQHRSSAMGQRASISSPAPMIPPTTANHASYPTGNASYEKHESPKLKMAIKDFQIRALYIFWTDVTPKEAKELHIQQSQDDLTYTFKLELPDLSVDIYSWQFYVMLNVIRNVLLAPPPVNPRRKVAERNGNSQNEEGENNKVVVELTRDRSKNENSKAPAVLDMNNKFSRDEIRLLIEESLQYELLHLRHIPIARFMEVFIGRVSWVLRLGTGFESSASSPPTTTSTPLLPNNSNKVNSFSSSSEHGIEMNDQLVQIDIIGIYMTMTFTEERSMNSHFEIQRAWAKNISPSNVAGPSNSSNNNATPTDQSNVNATTGAAPNNSNNESNLSGLGGEEVLLPVLQHVDTCTRCGKTFTLSDNHSTACTFHADDDGNPGNYKELLLPDELTGKLTSIKAWTCCNRHHEFAAGCCARPHLCKEVMFSIRAETNPTVRIENIDLTVLKTLEVSIFPGTNYDLRIQITRALIDIIHNYFSIDNNPSTAAVSSSVGQNGPFTSELVEDDVGNNGEGKKKRNFLFKLFSSKKSSKESNIHEHTLRHNSTDSGNAEMVDLYLQHVRDGSSEIANSPSSSASPMMIGGRRQGVRHRGSSASVADTGLVTPPASGNSRSSTRQSTTRDSITQQQAVTPRQKKSPRQEGLYIRYFRLGEINVDISTIGFAINLDRFKAVMETFHCRREVLDWKRLIWNIERHLAWSLTKNTASSSMSKIGDFFRFSGFSGNNSAKDVANNDALEAEMSIEEYTKQLSTKRNMLLGSPTVMKWKVRNPFSFVSSNNNSSNTASVNVSGEKVKRPTRIPKFLLTRQDESSESNDEI